MSEQVEYRTISRLPGYRFGDDGSCWSELSGGGRVANYCTGRWRRIRAFAAPTGYLMVNPHGKPHSLHSLILEAFVGPRPTGMHACHNNGIKSDCRLSNLRWDTPKANMADKIAHGTSQCGERNGSSKLTAGDVLEIRRLRASGIELKVIAQQFGITFGCVSGIAHRRSWKHLV